MRDSEKLRVLVLGGGAVASALAAALADADTAGEDVTLVGVWARRERAAAKASPEGFAGWGGRAWPLEMRRAEVLVLAVSDDAIAKLARDLLRDGVLEGEPALLHCCGALAAEDVFSGIPASGIAMMHPLRAFVHGSGAAEQLPPGTIFAIEGDGRGTRVARRICEGLKGKCLDLQAEQVAAYHAAASISSNFMVALLDFAMEVLSSAGIDSTRAETAFAQLAQGALKHVEQRGLAQGLTGPILRGDAETVGAHLKVLRQGPDERAILYQMLGRRCLSMARNMSSDKLGDKDGQLSRLAEILRRSAPSDLSRE